MIQVSVIVCTYNRVGMLEGALQSLIEQTLEPDCYEVIVVDNASTDATPALVKMMQNKHPTHNIQLLLEAKQGLGFARNTGWRRAQGNYVAYLDDDARAAPDWLETSLELLKTITPPLDCVGGPILPFYDSPPPVWFKDEYETRDWGAAARFLQFDEVLSGSNMIWRKEMLRTFNGFAVAMGVKGEYLSLGEESALFRRIWQQTKTPHFYYSPNLEVRHWVPAYKMTVSYQLKRVFVSGQVKDWGYNPTGFSHRLWLLARLGGYMLKFGLESFKRLKQHNHWQNWLVEEWRPVVKRTGIFLRLLGLIVPVKQR